MKCQECGHDYPSTITRCTRCGELNPRRNHAYSSSRLIEFPRKARADAPPVPNEPSPPEWKAEIKERVRAAKARRNAEYAASAATSENHSPEPRNIRGEARASSSTRPQEMNSPMPDASTHKEERPSGRDRSESASARPPTKGITLSSEPARQESRSNYHIADAALARVRRASEKARRDRLPRIDAPRTEPTTKRTITADYQATARALEPAIEIELSPAPIIEPSPAPTAAAAAPARSKSVTTVRKELPRVETESSIYPLDSPATSDTAIDAPFPSTALEEIEPCDYLEAEVRKFGHLLVADESEATEIPPRSVHFTTTFIDLFVIAASSTPFLALVEILNGDFADSATWISSAMIVLLVAFFYLAITQCLCGKTFGMMLTNTRIVEAKTQESPTVARALLRAAAYFADLPFLVGLLWPLTNRRHRGLQDYLSGTLVARDY